MRKPPRSRIIRPIAIAAFLGVALAHGKIHAQAAPSQTKTPVDPSVSPILSPALPDSPGQAVITAQEGASIHGEVTDPDEGMIVGARVTLERGSSMVQETLTIGDGSFTFTGLEPGTFRVTIRAKGFAPWVKPAVILQQNGGYELPPITLEVASADTVDVVFSRYDLAEEQMKAEEKQRVLGIFPNFYASYVWNAAPLSSGQKFRLALRNSTDPIAFLGAGVTAGIEQAGDYKSGYGPGAQGYAKRYGASYADGFISTMIGGAILPSLLHQDPRYFYKGTGSITSRALYAISTVVICRGDNGKWQPNYSNVLGNLAAAGISNAYYPSTDRDSARVTIDNALIGTASGAAASLIQEFLLKKISNGLHRSAPSQP